MPTDPDRRGVRLPPGTWALLIISVGVPILVALVALAGCGGNHQPVEEKAFAELQACLIDDNGGPDCYRLPTVLEAQRHGWTPPSYYEVVEGDNYHE